MENSNTTAIETAKTFFEGHQAQVYALMTPNQALLLRQFEIVSEEELAELPESVIKYTLRLANLIDVSKSVSMLENAAGFEVVKIAEMDAAKRMRLMEAYCVGMIKVGKLSSQMTHASIQKVFNYLRNFKDELLYCKYAFLFVRMLEE